jgi:aminopeptidase N
MKTNRALMLLMVLALVATVACNQNTPKSPQAAPPLTGAVATAAPAAPAATAAPPSQAAPTTLAPQPAADNWDDHAIFRAGLIKDEQKTLDQLPGASVYHLDVQVADDFVSLQGQERVRYTNQASKPLDAVYFQLFPNMSGGKSTVSAVKVDGQEVQPVYESENSTVRVPLTTPLQPSQHVVVQMDFQVELPRESGGNYGLLGYIDNILVLDGFYPAIPVYDEKGWHAGKVPPNADSTFQDASFYMVRVTAPANLIVIASGIQVDQTKTDNRQIVTFAAGPARDFYLAASDRFAVVSETVGETKVNSYAFKDRTEGAQLALRTATNALKSYNARFGTYPYTEFDVVSTPMQNAYGIEYPGITGINYAMYDLGATIGGLPASVMLESTVAHEVGHQWFYNVVGNDQINEPWLDESAVQYITGLYFLDMYGQQGMASYRDSWLSRWDRVNRELIPIGMPAGSYQGKEYGAIVYGRGPLFVEALAQKMGQATFDSFLRDYVQSHKWGIGTTASFKQLAEKQCQCDLVPPFDEWVYKK